MKGKRSYIVGGALIAGAASYNWWPPELKAQAGELIAAAVGAAILALRLAIKGEAAKLIAEMKGPEKPPEG